MTQQAMSSKDSGKPTIVVVGAGFGGVKCAKILAKAHRDCRVRLFNPTNYMQFTPLLADVAGSSLSPRAVTAPLRQMLPKVDCRAETVTAVHADRNEIEYLDYGDCVRTMHYDHLVLAVGSRVDLGRVPGMVNYAMPLKNVGDAIRMRKHVIDRMEQANATDDPDLRRFLLTFTVIGGGFSGVEVAGELNDLTRHIRKYYPEIPESDIQFNLVHSRAQILPEVVSPLRDFALKKMQKTRIRFYLESRASVVKQDGVELTDGTFIKSGTIICTVGNSAAELVQRMDADKEKGRLLTQPDMRLTGSDNIWAVGDCALIHNSYDDKTSPPTAQYAERQGRQTAENILRVLRGEETRPFRFKLIGVAAGIGARKGVAQMFGMKISGFFAFWLWRSAFLAKLPSFLQKIKVGFDWAWEMIFPRDMSIIDHSVSQSLSQLFFATGDTIISSDSIGESLYAIEEGSCELIRMPPEDAPQVKPVVLAVVGRGELLGPHSLKDYSGNVELRARTNTKLILLPSDFLQQISGVLRPVNDMINERVYRRQNLLKFPRENLRHLETIDCTQLMQPYEADQLSMDAGALDAYRHLNETNRNYALIVEDDCLRGVVTKTDLIKGLIKGRDNPVSNLMTEEAIVVRENDSAATAATTMIDHGFKFIPVVSRENARQVSGIISSDALFRYFIERDPLSAAGES